MIYSLFCLLFASLLLSVSAHNWMGSIGRGRPLASTRYPFPHRLSDKPHLQVGINQTFTMEWSIGHGNLLPLYNTRSWSYVVIMHFDDQDKLPLTNGEMSAIVDRYIRDAPNYRSQPSFVNLTGDPFWKTYQLHPPLYTTTGQLNMFWFWNNFNSTLNKYYARQILPNDTLYIERDAAHLQFCKNKASICKANNPDSQWLYHDYWQRDDRRFEYIHPAFPWIEAVHRFETAPTETVYVNQYHIARIRIPARKGPGNYLAWWRWRGYNDVVDVNVQPNNVTHIYGKPAGPSGRISFTRVDHCQYTNIQNPVTPCRIIDRATMNISRCLQECWNNPACNQVQVVRASNPAGSLNSFANIPTILWETSGMCSSIIVQKRYEAGCRKPQPMCNITAALPDDYICFGSQFLSNSIFEATPAWTISNEPEDPVFFNTCYEKNQNVDFLPFPAYPRNKPSWVAGDYCVDCQFLNQTLRDPVTIAPNWERGLIREIEGRCQDCDKMGI